MKRLYKQLIPTHYTSKFHHPTTSKHYKPANPIKQTVKYQILKSKITIPQKTHKMLHPPSSQQTKFMDMIKAYLQGISEASLTQFGKKLFPIMSSSNIFASLYNCFHTFYTIRINKGEKFDDGSRTVLKYAEDMKDQAVLPKIRALLEDQAFTTGLEEIIEKELNQRKNVISIDKNARNTQQNGTKPSNIQIPSKKKPASSNNVVDISDDSPAQKQPTSTTTPTRPPQKPDQATTMLNTDPYEVPNLAFKPACLCGKSCAMMNPKKDFVFKCCHCQQFYHIECMQRGKQALSQTDPIRKLVSCAYCHLKELNPLKEVQKTLFVGVLKQGRKRHEVVFNLDMMDLKTKKWRVQVRCFRLKQKIQTFCLFPDSASFSINNRFQKQFLPLPKQSSLKYRKDQPFLLTQHLINHQNKLTIIERIPKKQSKDDRIEPENHLLGIYLVEEKGVQAVVKEIKESSVFTFHESKSMLDRCLRIGDVEDITCEVLKIPIICTLTIERIKTPVRGVFCSHFQCFDLNNFLVLTSSSVNPRWLCPLCKQPAYNFKYDIIIGSIIEEYAKFQPTEIMFTKDGQFKVYSNQDVCAGPVTNIHDLSIDSKFKRQLPNPANEEQVIRESQSNTDAQQHKIETQNGEQSSNSQKKSMNGTNNAKNFEIPTDANIISLDDD